MNKLIDIRLYLSILMEDAKRGMLYSLRNIYGDPKRSKEVFDSYCKLIYVWCIYNKLVNDRIIDSSKYSYKNISDDYRILISYIRAYVFESYKKYSMDTDVSVDDTCIIYDITGIVHGISSIMRLDDVLGSMGAVYDSMRHALAFKESYIFENLKEDLDEKLLSFKLYDKNVLDIVKEYY